LEHQSPRSSPRSPLGERLGDDLAGLIIQSFIGPEPLKFSVKLPVKDMSAAIAAAVDTDFHNMRTSGRCERQAFLVNHAEWRLN
jgi:hypothetical protein